jgi:hypothetical protein
MEDLRTRAQLGSLGSSGAVGTLLSRAEIAETAARGEFPATLLLELEQLGDVTAHAQVAVEWDEEMLEQLLASTDDPEIALWFDENKLAQAFDEVEAHSMRQKVAVLAVAAAAAGAGASPSLAMHAEDPGGAGGAGAAHATGPAVPWSGNEGALQQSENAARAMAPNPEPAPAIPWAGNAHALQQAANVQPSTPAVPWAGNERALQQDEQAAMAAGSRATGSEATSVTSVGDTGLSAGEIAGIATGAGALLITAAGFGVARKRQPPPLPA